MDDTVQQQELADWLISANGYPAARVLADGSVAAIQQLLFTRAILLGCNRDGWSTRFCFKDFGLAQQRFAELQSEDDEPAGYIARR